MTNRFVRFLLLFGALFVVTFGFMVVSFYVMTIIGAVTYAIALMVAAYAYMAWLFSGG